jgi:hypothetical protein
MKNWIYSLLIITLASVWVSCSDAEIIAGTYEGKIYRADTLNATAKILKVNDGYVQVEVMSPGMNEIYIDFAQLTKTAPDAYNLRLANDTGGYNFTGYYYEGYLYVNSWTNGYHFDGWKH